MIRLARPLIGREEEKKVLKVMRSGLLSSGAEVRNFERKFSSWLGRPGAVATSSGTTALDLALKASGVFPGEPVLTTPFSFIATANAIIYNRALPVFVDIDPKTFNLCPQAVCEALKKNRKIKKMVLVHLFGLAADMEAFRKIKKEFGVFLIEDCAQAMGATNRGRKSGAFGEMAAFSFYATKNITTGEGGMVVSSGEKRRKLLHSLVNHGRGAAGNYERLGYNYRMTNIAAALGTAQMEKLALFNRRRMAHARVLDSFCRRLDWLIVPRVPSGYGHVFHQYTVRLKRKVSRKRLLEFLRRRGIEAGVFYPRPIYRHPFYQKTGYRNVFLPEAEKASREVLSLPVHPGLKRRELEAIGRALGAFRP